MTSLADKFASRLANLTPFGKRNDDPLANLKAASRWVENLPIGDAFKCQEANLNALKRFNENSTQYTKDRLAIFMLLDEKSRDLQDTLVRQYLRNPRMSRPAESQLWHAVYGLYWEVARGYHAFVLHLARTAGKVQHEDAIPLITLRAIRTFGQLLKWRAIRYLPAGDKLWLRLHNLYRIAETEGFHRQTLWAYAEDTAGCSCETAYLHILMLSLAHSGTLYPRQIDQTARWLCGWHDMLQMDRRPAAQFAGTARSTPVWHAAGATWPDGNRTHGRKPRVARTPAAPMGFTGHARTAQCATRIGQALGRRDPRSERHHLPDQDCRHPCQRLPLWNGPELQRGRRRAGIRFHHRPHARTRLANDLASHPAFAGCRALGHERRKRIRIWRHRRIARRGLVARGGAHRRQVARRPRLATGGRAPAVSP